MPFGRSKSTPSSETPGLEVGGSADGKGRPTPKRADARKARRTAAPTSSKGASAAERDRNRLDRRRAMEALRSGDERYLPARDAGPERRFARDFVDSRFTFGQMFFVAIIVALVGGFLLGPVSTVAAEIFNLLGLVSLVVIVIDSSRHSRATKAAVAEKYGDAAAQGISSYIFLRAMYPRRYRRPRPKVGRGGAPL